MLATFLSKIKPLDFFTTQWLPTSDIGKLKNGGRWCTQKTETEMSHYNQNANFISNLHPASDELGQQNYSIAACVWLDLKLKILKFKRSIVIFSGYWAVICCFNFYTVEIAIIRIDKNVYFLLILKYHVSLTPTIQNKRNRGYFRLISRV